MPDTFNPINKRSLADNLAHALRQFIIENGYRPGAKLPATTTLAQEFGVGVPTLREALKTLETIGIIQVRHGSGVYVGEHLNSIFLMNPIVSKETPTKKQLQDLIEARISIEPTTAALAAKNATPAQIKALASLLADAETHLDYDSILNHKNMLFHRKIAEASGNSVFSQIMNVLTGLFQNEQRLLIDIFHSKKSDHQQHQAIFEALKNRDSSEAYQRMRTHLEGVLRAIEGWEATG